jgi:hypothetical protein
VIGAAVGIAVLSTFAATATTHFFYSHSTVHRAFGHATVHGYRTASWWSAGIFFDVSLLCGVLVRSKTRMHASDAEVIEELAEVVPAL